MSQYPPSPYGPYQPSSPYTAPGYPAPYGYGYGPDLLAPARRAGIMMFVLGLLMTACSGLCIASVIFGLLDQAVQQDPRILQQIEQAQLGMDALQFVKVLYGTCGGLGSLLGLILVALAFPVRKGGMASSIIALVLCVLTTLMFLFFTVAAPLSGDPTAILVGLPGLGIFGALVVMLAMAIRSISRHNTAMRQMQAQWMQYQQQYYGQMSLGAVGSGYAQQQQPPPPPPPPAT